LGVVLELKLIGWCGFVGRVLLRVICGRIIGIDVAQNVKGSGQEKKGCFREEFMGCWGKEFGKKRVWA